MRLVDRKTGSDSCSCVGIFRKAGGIWETEEAAAGEPPRRDENGPEPPQSAAVTVA
jgi:hypothetical protein